MKNNSYSFSPHIIRSPSKPFDDDFLDVSTTIYTNYTKATNLSILDSYEKEK
jgi:hypothetical protein